MKARDLRKPLETTMPQTIGLACGHPTTLLLVQPAQHQIEMPMIFPFRMFTRPTGRAATFVNRQLRRHLPTPSLEWTAVYTKRGISRNRSWSGSKGTTRAPTLGLSKLNRPASKLAVYASQGGSPHRHARLASRCWSGSPGRAWLPAGSHRKVSERSHPPLPGLLGANPLTLSSDRPLS